MNVGDPFVRHTSYCFQVLEGARADEFNDAGLWPSREPAEVSDDFQATVVENLRLWKDLVKKYANISQTLDPREMFVIAMLLQRWVGPVLEIGTHRGITTCFMSEVMNVLKRKDWLYTVEIFLEGTKAADGTDTYPGEFYLKAIQQFRAQRALHRVVPIIGDSHRLQPLLLGIRPTVLFLDGDNTPEGLARDLALLDLFQHPFVCLIHDINTGGVLAPVLESRRRAGFAYANFHTGAAGAKGLAAISRI
jgi:hypothetical protein